MSKFALFTFLLVSIFTNDICGQAQLEAYFNFDVCDAIDQTGRHTGVITPNAACECGAEVDGLTMDGNRYVEFSRSINQALSGSFSLSFYAKFAEGNRRMEVLSLATRCTFDSIFQITYDPNTNLLRASLSDSELNVFTTSARIDQPACWNYIVFTLDRSVGSLYINGEKIEDPTAQPAPSEISLYPTIDASLRIGDSPCARLNNDNIQRFEGAIDEFRLYRGVLTERQIQSSDLNPDRILTNDTTIFIGETVPISTGQLCSNNFNWTPASFLDDPSSITPIFSAPVGSHPLQLEINDGACQNSDEITINVVDSTVIDCGGLLLPNAFTPNGDGINDVIGISTRFLVDSLESFEIFDKWGGRLFYTTDPTQQWDGLHQINNTPAQPSTYVYRVVYQCRETTHVKSGIINLLK